MQQKKESTMPSEKKITETMQAYVDAVSGDDVEAVVALFSEDAVVEDPIGSGSHIGHDALREFYQIAVDSVEKMVLEGNPRIRDQWGACAMLAYPKGMDMKFVIETLDVMAFNDAGKITRMTAYWGDSNMRQL
jgi:steroid delta-isomerase